MANREARRLPASTAAAANLASENDDFAVLFVTLCRHSAGGLQTSKTSLCYIFFAHRHQFAYPPETTVSIWRQSLHVFLTGRRTLLPLSCPESDGWLIALNFGTTIARRNPGR